MKQRSQWRRKWRKRRRQLKYGGGGSGVAINRRQSGGRKNQRHRRKISVNEKHITLLRARAARARRMATRALRPLCWRTLPRAHNNIAPARATRASRHALRGILTAASAAGE